MLASSLVATMQPATASAQTQAGTPITNVATLRYDSNGQTLVRQSNPATLIVAERLDVRLTRESTDPVLLGVGTTAVAVTLTNGDNGEEAFVVAGSIDAGSATVRAIAIDRDGDGLYDPTRDTVLRDGVTPVLAPGQALSLLVVLMPADPLAARDAGLTITAQAATGSGPMGQTYVGRGDGGGDAVVGPTGASATVVVPVRSDAVAGPTLVKTQSVLATDGSANAYRDAVVTYTLEARFPGALGDARIDDPIPAGTAYVPGSLTLDGAVLTDGADGDPGQAGASAIAVTLAEVAAGSTHIVQFKTKIQ